MIIESAFRPAWWLANPHAQTIYPTLARRVMPPISRVERLDLPDGDFIELAWGDKGLKSNVPLVILLHGLGGSAYSTYIAGLMQAVNQQGYRAVVMLFRGAGSEPNRLPRAYHSGETSDLNWVLNLLAEREPDSPKAAVGISLGGNVLLKWLGEQSNQSILQSGVAVSVPFKLQLAADKMNQGFARLYQAYLLREMRRVFSQKLALGGRYQLPPTLSEVNTLRCFWTFDDKVTAPLHGFQNVHEYYREASSAQYLCKIKTPTLIIHAIDDPFMTPEVVPTADELAPEVTLELSRRGGHVGFIGGQVPGSPSYWLDHRVPEYLQLIFKDYS